MSEKIKDELEYLKHLTEPFYFKGSEVGVLLVHGFTASPTETLPLGKFLHKKGYSIHGVRLAGHGTNYLELPKYTWQDWYKSVEAGYFYLKDRCQTIIPIGVSLGAMLCLYLTHHHHHHHQENILKLCLLAPPFALRSRLVGLAPLLRIFKKFSYKGEETLKYFKDHRLYSYMYRPTDSIIQLTQFLKHVRRQPIHISTPTLISFGAQDDMILIPAIMDARKKIFSSDAEVEILELLESGHIITVEPDSEELFQAIEKFIKK